MSFPRIAIAGSPRERGRSYGSQGRELIETSIAAYGEVFSYFAGWDWPRAREFGEAHREAIAAFEPRQIEEIEGIAEGAGVDAADVLALNTRTEILAAAALRSHEPGSTLPARPPECTALAASGPDGAVIGQNWDWLAPTAAAVVILDVAADDGRPRFTTVVEAGLLAKIGLNSAGLAVATNALGCDRDCGAPGVPYHSLLRALHESRSLAEAEAALARADRSASANFLLADAEGGIADHEGTPGEAATLHEVPPHEGLLTHTNHFIAPGFGDTDTMLPDAPSSPARLVRIRELAAAAERIDAGFLERALADHEGHPAGICTHRDPAEPEIARWQTLASIVIEPAAGRIRVAAGQPCRNHFETIEVAREGDPDAVA